MKKASLIFSVGFLAVALVNTVSCTPKFVDYTHDGSIKLQMDYKGKDFYTDGIEQVEVAHYIDGDTTHFKSLKNSSSPLIKSRYYGIDTPESTGKIEEYGEEAKQFTKGVLKNASENGTIVVTGASLTYAKPETDSTGSRYLSLIWVNETEKDAPYDSLVLLNLYIVQEGLSYVKALDKIPDYEDTFLAAESQAKAHKLNLFSGKPAELFNYGSYEAVSLLEIRQAIEANLKDGTPNPFDGMKVRFRGTVTSYSDSMLYVASYFNEETGSTKPGGEWAGINIYTGAGSIPTKYTIVNTYIEVAGTLSDSEEFGFQMSGCDFTRSQFKPEEDLDTNKAQVIFKAEETPDEFKVPSYEYSAQEINSNISDKLFMEIKVKEELTCYRAYLNENSDKFTLYFKDPNGKNTPFNMYVPVKYYPDPVNEPLYAYTKPEEFEGKKFKVKGLYSFRKYTSNGETKISYQLIMRHHDRVETPDLEIVTD